MDELWVRVLIVFASAGAGWVLGYLPWRKQIRELHASRKKLKSDILFAKMLESVDMEETEKWLQDLIDRRIIVRDVDGKLDVRG